MASAMDPERVTVTIIVAMITKTGNPTGLEEALPAATESQSDPEMTGIEVMGVADERMNTIERGHTMAEGTTILGKSEGISRLTKPLPSVCRQLS